METSSADKSNAIDMLCSGECHPKRSWPAFNITPGQLPKSEIEKEDYEKNFDEVPRPCKSYPIHLHMPENTLIFPISKVSTEEREEWLSHLKEVAVSSDAFVRLTFPLQDLLGKH